MPQPIELKPLDILLYKGQGFTSWIIQTLTQSPYNHVAVIADPKMHLVIESNTGRQSGVHAVDLRKIDRMSVDVYRLKSGYQVDVDVVISRLVEALGARYDLLGVIWLGILKLIGLLSFSTDIAESPVLFKVS